MLKRIPKPHHTGDFHVEGTVYAEHFRPVDRAEELVEDERDAEATALWAAYALGFVGGVLGGIVAVTWVVR